MARLMKDMVSEVLYEAPRRPKPQVFSYQRVLDRYELDEMVRRPTFVEHLKKHMAHGLATHIIEECQLFQVPGMGDLYRGVPIRMELTINDRGSYENFVPIAKRDGQREGVAEGKRAVMRTIPYGFEPEQYYE